MSFSLNGILLSDYGIYPSVISGSTEALSGQFDLPKRIGTTYQKWDDGGEIEPFVDSDEIFLGGRDLVFNGYIRGSKAIVSINADKFRQAVSLFPDLVTFHSDQFGDFQVKVKRIDTDINEGFGIIKLTMREPVVDLSGGVLPATENADYMIDYIPLKSFGMYVTDVLGRGFQAADSKEYFTVYGKEAVQVNGMTPNEIKIVGFIKASSLATFQTNVKNLWKLLTEPGLRALRLNNYVTIDGFSADGFTVSRLTIVNNSVAAIIEMKMINVSESLTLYKHADADGKVLMTEEGKILVI